MLDPACSTGDVKSGKERQSIDQWAEMSSNRMSYGNIIGQSREMKDIFRLIEKVADKDCTVLINGGTGTGKGLVSRAIHERSKRNKMPFI